MKSARNGTRRVKFEKYGITRAKALTKSVCLKKVNQYSKIADSKKVPPRVRKRAAALAAFYKFKSSRV